jgi:hypothetical protein
VEGELQPERLRQVQPRVAQIGKRGQILALR